MALPGDLNCFPGVEDHDAETGEIPHIARDDREVMVKGGAAIMPSAVLRRAGCGYETNSAGRYETTSPTRFGDVLAEARRAPCGFHRW